MIIIEQVENKEEGQEKTHKLLTEIVGVNTLLALSGGTSVDYRKVIVDPGDIHPGDVCVVDERYGNPFHLTSNELLIKNTGLLEYLEDNHVPFSKYLQGIPITQTAQNYDQVIRTLFNKYDEMVGIMGVGINSHTAGIFPNSKALTVNDYVTNEIVDDTFPQRLTITLKALEEFTTFIVMIFGEEKREVLTRMLNENENDIKKYPAIFYRKCKANVYVVTDINI